MRLEGSLKKYGKYWLVEVPALDAMTQGKTRKDALLMINDYLSILFEEESKKKINFTVSENKGN